MTDVQNVTEEDARYLLFRVAGELYGTPLLGIREVVAPQDPKPIPNTVPFFTGVINLRGQVIGVIDLRKRFGRDATHGRRMALMVFETDAGPLSALVDEIECVVAIPSKRIEEKPLIKTNVPADYLLGIGNVDGRLVSLIDLNRILGSEELKAMNVGL